MVVWVVPFSLLENRSHSSQFPLSWKDTIINRLENICVSDGAIMLPAIFRSLVGRILNRPAAFFSFSLSNSLRTTSTLGTFIENVVLIESRYDSGSSLEEGISEASLSPMLEKCIFNSLAIAEGTVIVLSPTVISEIFFTLFGSREDNSLINCQVFIGFDLLDSQFLGCAL